MSHREYLKERGREKEGQRKEREREREGGMEGEKEGEREEWRERRREKEGERGRGGREKIILVMEKIGSLKDKKREVERCVYSPDYTAEYETSMTKKNTLG